MVEIEEISVLELGLRNAAYALDQFIETGQPIFAEQSTQKKPTGWTFLERDGNALYSINGENIELDARLRNPDPMEIHNNDVRPYLVKTDYQGTHYNIRFSNPPGTLTVSHP